MLHQCESAPDRSSSDALISLASQFLMRIAGATCAPPPKTNGSLSGDPCGPAGAFGTIDPNPFAEVMMQLDSKNNDDEPGRIGGPAISKGAAGRDDNDILLD